MSRPEIYRSFCNFLCFFFSSLSWIKLLVQWPVVVISVPCIPDQLEGDGEQAGPGIVPGLVGAVATTFVEVSGCRMWSWPCLFFRPSTIHVASGVHAGLGTANPFKLPLTFQKPLPHASHSLLLSLDFSLTWCEWWHCEGCALSGLTWQKDAWGGGSCPCSRSWRDTGL